VSGAKCGHFTFGLFERVEQSQDVALDERGNISAVVGADIKVLVFLAKGETFLCGHAGTLERRLLVHDEGEAGCREVPVLAVDQKTLVPFNGVE